MDNTFNGLVAAQLATFKIPTSGSKGKVVKTPVPDVVRLIKGTTGIAGKDASAILRYFVDTEDFSGDVKLNNYSFFVTADGLSTKLDAEYEKTNGVITKVIKPMEVMTLQMLRDVVSKVGKHLTVSCIYSGRYGTNSIPNPKLCVHDSRVKSKFTPRKRSSANPFASMGM